MKMHFMSKTEQLRELLKKQIQNGTLKPGARMLPENKLAKLFGVGVITVRRAMRELEEEGLIYRVQGNGTFVQESPRDFTRRIGIIVYHSDNPYYAKIVRIAEAYAHIESHNLLLCNSTGMIEKETAYIRRLMTDVDGFLICPASPDGRSVSPGLRLLTARRKPFVLMASVPESVVDDRHFNYVIPDDMQGGYLAARHLLQSGYKKVFFLLPDSLKEEFSIKMRLAGCRKAIGEAGLPPSAFCIRETSGKDAFHGYEKDGYAAAEGLIAGLEEKTAVFCSGDSLAIGLMQGLKERGIRVPEDIGVCGNDDIETAAHWGIDLTTVAHPASMIAERSVEILLELIRGGKEMKTKHCLLPVELRVRKTTQCSKNAVAK